MANLKFTANTAGASKKIDELQTQITKLETDIAKNKELNLDTKIAEAQVKGLKDAISSIMKDIAKETQQKSLWTEDFLHTEENIKKLKELSNQITILYKDIANNGGTKTQIAELNRLNASFNGTLSSIKRIGTEQQKQEADAIRISKNKINRIVDEKNAMEQVAKADAQRMSAANKSMTEYQKLVNEYISLLKKAENAKNNTTSKNALKPSEEQYMYGYPDGTAGRFDQIQARLKEIRDTYGDIPAIQAQIAQMDDHMANQIGYQQRLAKEKAEFRQIIDLQKQAYNVEQKMQQLASAPQKNKNMINELRQEHQELIKQYNAWKSVTKITETESKLLKEQSENFQRISNQAQAHAKDMSSLNKNYSKFGATVENIFKYIITYQLYNRMVEGVQNAIQVMKDLDTAFTNIQMVTMDTEEKTYQLSLEYNNLAKEMGATTQEIAEGATEWLRQGKTTEETTELLKSSMTLSKVGAIESSQATELLTSSLNGYKIAAQDAMSVVDKISSIDLAAATSSEELAVALSRTANSASDAEVSLDKLLGMIGTVSSVTRKSASTIGESFKTIFARMSNVAAGKDTDDEGESLNDVEKTLNSLGITLRKSQYEWKSFEDVLDEVAEKWSNFEDTEQSKIATAIAGVRQQENFRALMNNWDSVKDLTAVAENSMGSASEKMEIYLDSVEAKTKEVQAAWERFIIELNQSDSYKGALDIVIFLIDNLPTVATLIMSVLTAWKSWSVYTKIADQINAATALMTIKTQTQMMADNLASMAKQSYTTAIQENTTAIQINSQATNENQISGQTNLLTDQSQAQTKQAETSAIEANTAALEANTLAEKNNQIAGQISLFTDNSQAIALQNQQFTSFKKNITGATTLTGVFTKAIQKNTNSLLDGASGVSKITSLLGKFSAAIGIVSTILSIASVAIMAYNKRMSDLSTQVEKSSTAVDGLQEDIDTVSASIGEISSIQSQYEKGLISLDEKTSTLKEIESELNSIYKEKVEKINLVNKAYEEQIDTLKTLQDISLQEQLFEAQKGEKAREELLNRSVQTHIGSTEEIENLSDENLIKLTELASKNNLEIKQNILGASFLTGTARDLKKFTNELEEYQKQLIEKGKTEKAQEIGNILNSDDYFYHKGLKNENETTGSALEEEERAKYLEFKVQNKEYFNAYNEALEERKSLAEKYNTEAKNIEDLQKQKESASTEEEKKSYDKRIQNAKASMEKYYDLLVSNDTKYQEAKDNLFRLTNDDSFKNQIKEDFEELENIIVFKTDNTHIDKLNGKMQDTYDIIKNLDNEFEKGKISSKEYFDGINKEIDKIDITNLEEVNTAIESLFGNNISYLDNFIGNLFENNIADAEDVKNLQAYTSNMEKLIELLKKGNGEGGAFEGKLDSTVFTGNGYSKEAVETAKSKLQEMLNENDQRILELNRQKAALGNKEYSVTGTQKAGDMKLPSRGTVAGGEVKKIEVLESGNWKELKSSSGAYGLYYSDIKKQGTEQYQSDLDKLDEKIESTTKIQNKLNEEINKLDTSEGLDNYQKQLNEVADVLEDMNIEKTQNAFDTLAQGIESGAIDDVITSLDKLPEKYRNAFLEVSNDIVVALGSSNEEVRKQAESSLEALIGSEADMMLKTVDFANLSEKQVTQMATEIANKSIIASGGVTDALQKFATENNKIASTAMGQAVQTLGLMLGDIGDALSKLKISIPIKIPKVQMHLAEFLQGKSGLVSIDGTDDSSVEIGGNNVVQGINEIKNTLTNSDYADALGKLMGDGSGSGSFNPYSFNPSSKKDTNNDSSSRGGSGGGSGYSAEDAAKDLKDILEDIKDYEADIELDLEDQTEQLINHYNLEKNRLDSLKEELDYYEGIYDSVEDTTKWLETQEKLLENQSKTVAELQKSNDKINKQREKIYKENSKYKVSGWFDSEGNDTLAYGDLINSFEYQINAIQKETAKKMRDVYNSVSGSTSETAIENAKDRIEELEKEADKRIEGLEKEREKVENIHDSVSELNDAWDENQEAIRDALTDMHDRIIDIRDTLVDQLMEQLEKAVDKQNESIEKDVTRMEQLVSIREKYYEILNETIDTQADLDSELQSSLDSFEYLDEQMRQLMFNEEDYKALSETLTGIQEDIAGIWEDHYNKIDSLTDDEMYKAEYITAETERQLDMKMKEYELAKAELDVAKAKTNLQNVQNERNVRMFVNGQWQWVLFKLTHLVINGKYKHGELLETREVISTKTEYLKWYRRTMSKNDIIYGNQQPSPKGKVHRLSERSRT